MEATEGAMDTDKLEGSEDRGREVRSSCRGDEERRSSLSGDGKGGVFLGGPWERRPLMWSERRVLHVAPSHLSHGRQSTATRKVQGRSHTEGHEGP